MTPRTPISTIGPNRRMSPQPWFRVRALSSLVRTRPDSEESRGPAAGGGLIGTPQCGQDAAFFRDLFAAF